MNEQLVDQAIDIFCHRLTRNDSIGTNRRLIFTVPSIEESSWQIVTAKIILPADAVAMLAYMAAGADENTISRQLLAFDPRCAH